MRGRGAMGGKGVVRDVCVNKRANKQNKPCNESISPREQICCALCVRHAMRLRWIWMR